MVVKKIVDLSIPITNQTPIYPGDPKPCIHPAATFEEDGYHVSHLKIGSHTGTHVDAPYHFTNTGQEIDEVPLQKFIGPGVVFDVADKGEKEPIVLDDIKNQLNQCTEGIIALFHTGWSRYVATPKYFKHPYIGAEVIEALLEKGVRTFLIDALNIDNPDGESFIGHELITGVDGIIGENFTNFDQIDFPNPLIISLPLKLEGGDGSPVRAVAVQT
ncbi:cyclase family protein [Priestia flexa]|uniref:cyclase family protein n=1 Tax=Priestia flexa TaxID=86664 RepID=UPI001C95428E|nr:cyclase family protein [Priestia flexa]MBY6087968.1 cyclase family protein [Priestia flexa]